MSFFGGWPCCANGPKGQDDFGEVQTTLVMDSSGGMGEYSDTEEDQIEGAPSTSANGRTNNAMVKAGCQGQMDQHTKAIS